MKSILSVGFAAILVALLIVFSCQKSNNDGPDNPDKNKEFVTAKISGRVLDENNQPVNQALVKAGTASTVTDINGYFNTGEVRLDKNAGFIKVERNGYFQASRTIVVNAGVVNYVSMQLIKKTVTGAVSAASGGNINVLGGGSIVFSGNSFINTAGNGAYTGTVYVSTFFLNPTAANFTEIMPGTLRGINAANQETGLQSFGMMAVELTGDGGEKLQLAVGKTATLTFPIPAELQAQAPATIPLWSFNDTTGLWKEEGTATRQGNNYVGTVGHFSFWNCDYPYALVDFNAVIKDQNGKALHPSRVVLKTTGDKVSSYGYGYTDTTGSVSGKIPSGKTLQLEVYNRCNTLIYTQNIGPFSATANLGSITVNNAAATQVKFTGTVIICNAGAVTNGFVDIAIDSMHNHAVVTNGHFSLTITRCTNAPATAVVTAYDLTTVKNGPATNVAVNAATVNTGQLSACGNVTGQYLNYTLNGTQASYIPPADSLALRANGNTYTLWATRKSQVNDSEVTLSFTATGTGTVPVNWVNIYTGQNIFSKDGTININITEFGAAGGYISGNFYGNLKDSFSTLPVPVNLSFRVKK
jgi:hypothetical protein